MAVELRRVPGAPMAQSMVSGYQYRVADESQQAQSAV